ncbi:MAG: hypothetical protein AAGG68_07625 [Bacteroidota bacterium]
MSKIVKAIGEIDRNLGKKEIEALAKEDAERIILDDRYDLLKMYIEFKRYDAYLRVLTKEIQDATIAKAENQKLEQFEFGTAKLIVTQKRQYNYSRDTLWSDVSQEMNELKEFRKTREQFLKKIEGDFTDIVDEETGAIERVYAPEINYSSSLTVRL